MPRWEPGARERLREAALDLCIERGFANVTVADITDRAGLTRRTFFRHFADAREVLFSGSDELPGALADAVRSADPALPPFEAVVEAVSVVGSEVVARVGAAAARRNAVICASPELQERERTKLANAASAIAAAVEERGVPPLGAQVMGTLGATLFQIAMSRWAEAGGGAFSELVRSAHSQVVACLLPEQDL